MGRVPGRWAGLLPDLTLLRSAGGFRLVFASRTVTALGAQASEVALLVQAKQLTGSPLAVGLLGVVELVPLLVFGLYGGVLADRFDRRALMRWCEATLGGCAILLLVNALLPDPALWPLYAVTTVMMAAAPCSGPPSTPRYRGWSAGAGGVALVCALLPGFVRYKSEPA